MFPEFAQRQLWDAIGEVAANSSALGDDEYAKLAAVTAVLTERGTIESVGGLAGIAARRAVSAAQSSMSLYGNIVRDGWVDTELRRELGALTANERLSGPALIDAARAVVGKFALNSASTFATLAHTLDNLVAALGTASDVEYGLPLGLGLESVVPGGAPRDKVTILFGETGTYKTTLKDNIIDSIVAAGHNVFNCTLEDKADLTAATYLSRATGIPYARIATNTLAADEIELVQRELPSARVYAERVTVCDVAVTIDEVIKEARRLRLQRGGLSAVFVDYVQRVNKRGREPVTAYNEVVERCQDAAHADRVAYFLVSQVNREKMVRRGDYIPQLEDLFGSSAFQHGCKLAIATYLPSKYEPDPSDAAYKRILAERGHDAYRQVVDLWIRKNRVGPVDVHVSAHVDRPTGKMRPLRDALAAGLVGGSPRALRSV